MSSYKPTVLSGADYFNKHLYKSIFADERGYYFRDTGLLREYQDTIPFDKQDDTIESNFGLHGCIGLYGFKRGENVHVLDIMAALSDPLLARLPAKDKEKFRFEIDVM